MSQRLTEKEALKPRYDIVAMGIFLLFFVGLFECWIILYPHWLALDIVPPGDDPAIHLRIITDILHGRGWLAGLPYPPLFHWIVVAISSILHLTPLRAQWLVTTLMIGFVPTGIGGIFILRQAGKNLVAMSAGIGALIALLMLSRMPLRAWGDGNYPDLLAQTVLIPLMIYTLSTLHGKWNRSIALLVLLLLGSICATHAMSMLITLGLFFVGVCIIDLPVVRRLQLAGGALTLLIIAWIKIIGPTISLTALSTILHGQGGNVVTGLSSAVSQSTSLNHFAEFFGQPFLSATLLLLLLAGVVYFLEASARYTLLLLATWAVLLFLASRMTGFAVPDRFLRDLSYPLIALGATSITILASKNTYVALPLVCILGFAGIHFATYKDHQLGTFAPHPYGIRPIEQRADHATSIALQQLAPLIPPGATLITNQTTSYTPFLLQHTAIALNTPSVKNLHTPYYILIGPEPSGSLRSPAESELYHTITDYLKTIPGTVIIRNSKLTLTLVTQPVK